MVDSSRELEASEKSRDARERLPSPLPATIVGLGRPEPPRAAATAYTEDSPSRPAAKQTLVGFPSPPRDQLTPSAPSDAMALADAADDEVTVVGGYDDVTAVTPWDGRALARVLADAQAARSAEPSPNAAEPSPNAEVDSLRDGWPDPPLDTAPEAAPGVLADAPRDAPGASAELPEAPPATAFTEVSDVPRAAAPDGDAADGPPRVGDGILPETQKLVAPTSDQPSESERASSADAARLAAEMERAATLKPEESSSPDAVTEPLSLRSFSKPPPPPRPNERRSRNETLPPPSSDRDLFVSRDTELQLFAPPVEMFGPGTRSETGRDSLPSLPSSSVGTQSDAPWYRPADRESSLPPRRSRARVAVAGVLTAALGTGWVLTGGLGPSTGRVLVTVSGPQDTPVSGASVLVDGKPGCAPAPCRMTLDEGAYVLAVSAPSYRRAAEKALSVTAGSEDAVHFTLLPTDTSGIEVRSEVAGLRVLLDGVERGTTPLTVRGLAAGKHSIRIEGNPRYAALEADLELQPDKIAVFEPKLTAQTEVVAAAELDAAEAEHPPRDVAPPPQANAADSSTAARFAAELAKSRPGGSSVSAAKVDLDTPEAAPAVPMSKLSITSTPPSNVVVDGRPLGSTPREIEVSPGEHSVVFVHPTKGRKSVRVRAQGGKTALASVSF